MKNKLIVLAVMLMGVNGLNAIKGGITVRNSTKSRIFVATYALSPNCIGGCNYNTIDVDKEYLPSGSLALGVDGLIIYAPVIENGVAKMKKATHKAETNKVEVTIEGKDIKFKDIGVNYSLKVEAKKK